MPPGLAIVPIDLIQPCPIQPRVNVSVDLVAKLSDSIRSGRHQPLLEVEPAPGMRGRYQIVFGEQRWRAAKAAGLLEILVRVHPHLGYLERLEKQYEENHLRADLDVVEEAHCIVVDKTIRDIAIAEQLLRESLVPFKPLDEKRIVHRQEFVQHLDGLREMLVKHETHIVNGADGKPVAKPLSRWRETEKALGISESQRKVKVGLLRLDPEELDRVRPLPQEHAIQISRLADKELRTALIERAAELTHREVRRAVDRLLADRELDVDGALAGDPETPEPLTFESRLDAIADLCRQLVRALRNLDPVVSADERRAVSDLLACVDAELTDFRSGPGNDRK
ncbi:MAG TPA: ParB/RepB/Spo0J family partition protein [Candidatus Eisenbacteria bacterium]|nr:ParB/RepB/Spo0J family partition protein [Candidatus Eisenbacteria bacterium]